MRKISFLIVLLITTSIFCQTQEKIPWPTLANSDWPMIKHDPQFTGRSPYKGPQTATVVWTLDMEDGIFSGPVIGEKGNLFFGTYFQDPSFSGLSDYFYSYSSDGEFNWEFKLGRNRPPQTGIVIDSSGTIYFGSLDHYLYALNPDGTLKWEFDTGGPIFEVTMLNIDLEGNIYITNDNGYLFSVDREGSLNWKVIFDDGFWGKSPVFSPDGETIYIAGGDSSLYAIELDGSLKWEFECGEILRAPMVDNEGNIYFIPYSPQYLFSLNEFGTVNWKKSVNSLFYSISTIDNNGNIYYISTDSTSFPNKALFSVDYNGKNRWMYSLASDEFDDFWQPLICDSEGTIYVGSTRGKFYYAISNEGKLMWQLPLNGYQVDNTGAISKDGTLYLGVHQSSIETGLTNTLIAIRDTGLVTVDNKEKIPSEFALHQNYPNPFNPSTKIKFNIASGAKQSVTTLKVFDALGREVATLVNEVKPAGSYEVEFDGSKLTSGVYFYVLETGNVRLSKKMLLIK